MLRRRREGGTRRVVTHLDLRQANPQPWQGGITRRAPGQNLGRHVFGVLGRREPKRWIWATTTSAPSTSCSVPMRDPDSPAARTLALQGMALGEVREAVVALLNLYLRERG